MTDSQKQMILDHFDLGTSWLKEKEFIIISGAWIGEGEDGYPCCFVKAICPEHETEGEVPTFPVYHLSWMIKEEFIEEHDFYMIGTYRFSQNYNGDPTTLCDWDHADFAEVSDEDMVIYEDGRIVLKDAEEPQDAVYQEW